MKKTTSGFTIVELLIVIVVIAILAAITIVAFNGVQNRAHDSSVQSDLRSITQKFELFAVDNDHRYPATLSELTTLNLKPNKSSYAVNPTVTRNYIYCYVAVTYDDYAILAKSKSGNGYVVRKNATSPQPFTTTWETGTLAGTLCSSLGGSFSTNNAAGYWIDQTPNWHEWTGS